MPLRTPSAIRPTTPMPAMLSERHGLFALYALQHWESFAAQYTRSPLSPSYFYAHVWDILKGLDNTTRTTILKHLSAPQCLVCETPVDLAHTQLDHIIPLIEGGPEDLPNAIVLCRRCNSSKGRKDLLVWWQDKAYGVATLPRRVLCLYARIHWQHRPASLLDTVLPTARRAFLRDRAQGLQSDQHREALYGATYAGCGFWHWMHQEQ